MSSVYLAKRTLSPDKKTGKPRTSWAVRWEEGRKSKAKHLGSYPTKPLAEARRTEVRRQLARGEIPTLRVDVPDTNTRKLEDIAAEWLKLRKINAKPTTLRSFRYSIGLLKAEWGKRDPATITVDELQDWMGRQTIKASTLRLVLSHLSQIMVFADVEPNPVRSPKLIKPPVRRKRTRLPLRSELAAMYKALPEKNKAPVAMMEHGGLRISEVVALTWSDLHPGRGFLIVQGHDDEDGDDETKTAAGNREVKQIDGLPVIPERPDGVRDDARVFQNVTEQSIASAMRKACKDADVPHVNPHLLRKLHISRLMHNMGLDPASIAARVGHASPTLTFDVYTLMIPEEDHD